MERTILFVRDGKIKLRIPGVSERPDGTLWASRGQNPLLGITDQAEKERIAKLAKNKDFSAIDEKYFIKYGQNENGVLALTEEDWEKHPLFPAYLKSILSPDDYEKYQIREELRKTATMITKVEKIEDEGGKTVCAHHTVTLRSGKRYSFTDRNIFDFGRVINPEYEIAPGKIGGLRSGDNWQDFESGQGWSDVRPLTDEEKEAYNYVWEFGYHAGRGMRM